MQFIDTMLDLIFPRYCIACGTFGSDFCVKCISKCHGAERETPSWIFPLFDYRQPSIQKAIKLIKYRKKKQLVKVFAEILYSVIIEELSELMLMENFQKPILIPIPLSKKRMRQRGFNQAEILCKKIVEADKNNDLKLGKDILVKIKDTNHQTSIKDRTKRLRNLVGSFSVLDKDMIKNKNIILVDDVSTTGATLNEARRTLKKAGAKKIIAFTMAH